MAPPRVQTETNSVPNVRFHVKLVTCSLVQKSVGVVPITNGLDHVTHHVILFDVDDLTPHSTVLSIAKILISLVLNVNFHALGVTVLKVPKPEPVLSGKSSKWSCVGGEVRYRGLDIRLIIFYDVILELNVGLASFRFKSI